MKTCGVCNNEYDESIAKCPQCGSTLVKYTKGSESAAAEYKRLKEEISNKRKNRSLILGIGAALIILVVVIIIASVVGFVNDPQRAIAKESKKLLSQAEQMIDNGEYDSALGVLIQISTEWEDYSKTDAVRQNAERGILMDEINAYQSSGDYEGLIVFIDKNVANANSDSEIRAIYEDAAKKCKENALAKIAAFMESGDYLGAIQYVDVLGASMKKDADIKAAYDSAVANYEATVISKAESFAQAGDYTSARSTLSVAENYIGRTTALADKIAEVDERELTAEVLALIEAENYGDAIVLLNKNAAIVEGSPDLQTKLNTYTEKYRANVISEAASAYSAYGYQAAVSVLNSALKVLPNDSAINSEKAKYEAAMPVPITNLDCTYQGEYALIGRDSNLSYNSRIRDDMSVIAMDVGENKYSSEGVHYILCYYSERDDAESISTRTFKYFLNQKYDNLTGVFYRPYATLSCGFTWTTAGTLQIYGDESLLYSASILQDSFEPVSFSVPVTGVRELSIVLDGVWRNDEWDYGWFNPKVCVANLMVANDP